MPCPCDPELIKAAAAPVQMYLDGGFAWSVLLTLFIDPLYALVLVSTAILLAAQQSYLLSAWQLIAIVFAAVLVMQLVFRRIKAWREERRIQRMVRSHEEQIAAENAAYEAYCNEQNDNKPKEK